MPEKRKREIDNHSVDISQFSNEINDKEEEEYLPDRFPSGSFYGEEDKEYVYPQEGPHQEPLEWNSPQWGWRNVPQKEYAWKEKAPQKTEEGSRKKAKFRVCTNCGTTTTPSWRRSTNNKMLLCNACGLYQKLHGSDRPFSITPDGKTKAIKTSIEKGVCRGCGVSQTPLWKRGYNNESLCSSCSLLYTKRAQSRNEPPQESWKEYTDLPEEYTEWRQYIRNRGQYVQYNYEEPPKDDEYFSEERFREYKKYYDEEREE
ncbi:hypothetical protein NECID01_0012 [Nematocida sp. AWRm77]|nr:hypothetical protein NECID01_0012 [Nematocida sp. AWRm77]